MKSQRFKFTPLDNRKLPALRNRKKSHGATGRNLTVRAPGGEPRRPGPRDPPTTSPAGRESSARPAARLLPSREGRLDEGNVPLASNRPDKGRRRAAPAPAIFMSNAPYLTPMTWPATSSTEFQKILIPSRE